MPKITKTNRITYADILKKKKLNAIKAEKEKAVAIKAAKEKQFDEFVKETAKDMLSGLAKYQLRVFDANANSLRSRYVSEISIWAPWSKLTGK